MYRLAIAVSAVLLLAAPVRSADIHQLWDRQCGGCHGHAGAFARSSLVVVDGTLRGKDDGRDIRLLLDSHNGGYGKEDIAAIYAMLLAQVEAPAVFKDKCGECHTTAAQLVREQLVNRDGDLYGRHSHRRIADFLPRHGRLDEAETKTLMETLIRVEAEVHRP